MASFSVRRVHERWLAYPTDYRQFCAIIFVAGIGYGFVDILVPLYGDELGVSNLAIGVLFAVFSLPKAVVSPVVGALSDRMGHRRTIVAVGFVLAGVLYALVPLVGLITAFVAIRFLLGGLDAAIRPTAQTLISEVGGEDGRGASFGLYSSFRTFGTVVGPVAAGFVVASAGYVLGFGLTGAAFVAAGVLTYLLVGADFGPESRSLTAMEVARSVRESARWTSLSRPSLVVVVLYAVVFLRFVGLHAYVRFLPLYLETVGFSTGLVGVLFSIRTLSAAVCFPLGGFASDKFGRLTVLSTGVLLSGVAPLVLFFAPSLPFVVLGLLVAGVGRALFIPTLPALVSDLSAETARGSQIGGVNAVSSLAVGVAPLVAGAIGDRFGIEFILAFSGATLGVGVLLFGAFYVTDTD
jgi:MFS family permease